MGWKDDVKQVVEQNEKLIRLVLYLQGQSTINGKRIESLKMIIDQQIKGANRSADRMADRMIEMAMVNQGQPTAAASHRRTLDENPNSDSDLWQDNPETQWPPPGCDAVEIP